MSGKPELIYFEGQGLAEIIRLALAASGIEFTEVDLQTKEQFLALRPELLFGQVPRLRIDGLNLVQSGAIIRYVARKGHLFGKTDQDQVQIDALYEGTRDFYKPLHSIGFQMDFDKDKIKEVMTPNLEKYLPIFNKILKDSGTGFLHGNQLTLADLGLFETLLALNDNFGLETFQGYPKIQAFFTKISALDFVGNYLKQIRKPLNTPEFVAKVKKILY